jgi:uncharacterized membrane protein
MPIGVILLIVVEILIFLGFAERMIARMGLSKEMLLLFFGAMIVGSFIDIPLRRSPLISINVGGAIVPIILAVFILRRIDSKDKFVKVIFSVLVTGFTIFALTQLYQFEEGQTIIDTNYLFPIVAGVVAYLTGRFRRVAFVGGTLGFLIYDLLHLIQVSARGIPASVQIGGAGIFDSIVISGLLAVLLAEIVGETREEIAGRTGDKNTSMEAGELGASQLGKEDEGGNEGEDK